MGPGLGRGVPELEGLQGKSPSCSIWQASELEPRACWYCRRRVPLPTAVSEVGLGMGTEAELWAGAVRGDGAGAGEGAGRKAGEGTGSAPMSACTRKAQCWSMASLSSLQAALMLPLVCWPMSDLHTNKMIGCALLWTPISAFAWQSRQ